MLRDRARVTRAECIEAVSTYRGARHRELVDIGLCVPTAHDVDWILNCLVVVDIADELEPGVFVRLGAP